MIKSKRVGNTVICVIGDKLYQKNFNSNEELIDVYEKLMNVSESNEEELNSIKKIFAPELTQQEEELENKKKQLEKEIENQKSLIDWLKEIEQNGDEHFELEGTKLYMKGIKITVPEFLATEFVRRRENKEDFQSLINFWRLLALNNDPRCRENLFTFLSKHDLTITNTGYFVAYRNVDIFEEGNKELNDFVAEQWLKIKTWKKKPSNYVVCKNEGGYKVYLEHQVTTDLFTQVVGNLEDLYSNKSEGGTIYTDHHTGTFRIKIGEMVSMPKEDCNASQNETCSRGLHVANSSWLSQNYFGQQGIVCLVNPMHVVSVPYSEAGKLRCHKYLPIGLANYDENGKIIPIETKTFEYDFCENTEAEIQEMLNTSTLEQLKEHEIIPKELDLESLKNIHTKTKITLEDMNRIISNKVIKVNA
ncbi:MAG: hypothetical protein E6R13_03535 [Spirochaetes bacterium]|nr:MAG: hypothetical protein E6R13_03535 [Spirochaetota bacterium]